MIARFFLYFRFIHRPLSFSCPLLSCTVLGDCLSNLVVLQRCGLFFFKSYWRALACHLGNIAGQSIVSCLYPKYSHLVNCNLKGQPQKSAAPAGCEKVEMENIDSIQAAVTMHGVSWEFRPSYE
jgi:hypothetical protein